MDYKNHKFSFRVWGRQALFTDPVTKIGGEKFTYQVPTYEAIKGIVKSIYWKPTLIWHIDRVRVMKPIRTQSKSTKPLDWNGGNTLAIYTFLQDVEYQVEAHFEWNEHWAELAGDRNFGKHVAIFERMLTRGGRQDIFLGTRDCQGYVEPCTFGEGAGFYDNIDNLDFGLMFHSFGYPEETGKLELVSRFWIANMQNGVIEFPSVPEGIETCFICKKKNENKKNIDSLKTRFIRQMQKEKPFKRGENVKPVEDEAKELGL
ncbi:type I-C CRISPR-associated protein Cas5 [Aggregatibacter actinomycetemcomitans]|uniref:type I-C CRISPR-associated protein Cas5c n=1 Tax=Aggregatibacter actinomycetemcomitans TaxID=714 RepID=UPI00197C2AB3|nr:type I-C CRISPR-associated protein Cas5c [Aggregatibacter actinomycetemcomitans]MBN6067731.1 type I-C CRISPR-associated protein Cas5 [Aggregatibacter actinomycetemcomitans]MBN6085668.1 type I-C CRISPR-associated protein Cas5 [Aggregatibacter actinomycetemcomitans]